MTSDWVEQGKKAHGENWPREVLERLTQLACQGADHGVTEYDLLYEWALATLDVGIKAMAEQDDSDLNGKTGD